MSSGRTSKYSIDCLPAGRLNTKYYLAKLFVLLIFSSIQIIPQQNNNNDNYSSSDSTGKIKIPLLSSDNSFMTRSFNPLETKINYTALAGVGAATIASGIAVHIYQRNAWWTDQRTSFHFQGDNEYALGIDKAGHFFGAVVLAHLFSSALEAGNLQSETSVIWGSALSFAFQMYVETEDGFGPYWGFSPGDAIADFLGAGFALGRYYYPFLKNFQVKVSYYPSEFMRDGRHKGNAIDDYEGQKYWLSFRVKNLLPDNIASFWPDWLNISAGTGIKNLYGGGIKEQEFYIGFDLDTEAIPLNGNVWQFLKNTLNYVHFPMPGIRISKNTAFFVFLF